MKGTTLIIALIIFSISATYSQDYKSRNHKLKKKLYHKEIRTNNQVQIEYVQKKEIDPHFSKGIVKHKNNNNLKINTVIVNPQVKSNYLVSSDKNTRMKHYKKIPSKLDTSLTRKDIKNKKYFSE